MDKGISVYKKPTGVDNPVYIRTSLTIEGYTLDEICDALTLFEKRKIWDPVLKDSKIFYKNDEENYELLYVILKVNKNIIKLFLIF